MTMNSNATSLSSLPKSFPIPIEGREDFFSIDPKSFNIKQLNDYRKEVFRLMNIEKKNLKRITRYSNARIQTYNQGIILAEKAMKSNSPSSLQSNGSIDYFDPKTLTLSQLQLYIRGITEEIIYEKQLTNDFHNESTFRLQAYEKGIATVNEELSRRKEK